jgi:hypothetical protein
MSKTKEKKERFRGKSTVKDFEVQAAGVDAKLEEMGKTIIAAYKRMFVLEKAFEALANAHNRTEVKADAADWRSVAMLKLLNEAGTVKEDDVVNTVRDIKVKQFDEASLKDDADRGLVNADGEQAQTGMIITTSIKIFKDGQETSNNIPRSKVELGKNELYPELDTAMIGATKGETRRFAASINGETLELEATLLSLRKKPEAQVSG